MIREEFERDQPMRVLRVFRGVVVEGALDRYLERARQGTQQDGARPDGPGAVAMGIARPDGFLTATTWPDWPAIAAATGGDIAQPLATRHRDLLREGSPVHYELLATHSGPA